jgi:tetratricopeptide (TPR) repeat protein
MSRKRHHQPSKPATPAAEAARIVGRRPPPGLYAALLVVLTAAAYWPALSNDFVNWDDSAYVYENASLEDGSLRGLAAHFIRHDPAHGWTLPQVMGNYHPLTVLSLHLDRRLSASDAAPRPGGETTLRATVFHATNVALHAGTTLLVFAFVWRLLALAEAAAVASAVDRERVSFVTAALFALATVHVESVAWVSERKDVLYGFFFFLALLAWLEYLRRGGRRAYAAALAAFVLSLLSKGQAVTLAVSLPLLDVALGRRLRGRVLREKAPFVVLAIVFGLVAVHAQRHNTFVFDAQQPAWLRPLFAAYGLAHYVFRLFVPLALQVHYTYAQALSAPVLLYLICPIAAAIVIGATVWLWNRDRLAAFGLAFFAVNVAPLLQLLPVGSAVMADRYTYVPSAGIFLAAALAVERLRQRRPAWKRPVFGILLVYGLVLAAATFVRASVWSTSETLWTAELRRNPRSSRAHNNLGIVLRKRAEHAAAERQFRLAVEIDARNLEAWNNLGTALQSLGRRAEAVACFERALAGDPRFTAAHVNLGATVLSAGDATRAAAEFREALLSQPRYRLARDGLIEALDRLGRASDAEAECRAGLALEPDSPHYAYELGRRLAARHEYVEGLPLLERAAASDPSGIEVQQAVASAYLGRGAPGDVERAVVALRSVAAQRPSGSVWNELGTAERRLGRLAEAEADFRRALQADAHDGDAHGNLGALLAAAGRENEAVAELREAVRLRPDQTEPLRALAWLLATSRDSSRREEARRTAELAVERTHGEDALSLYALGLTEAGRGDTRQAAGTLARALAAADAHGDTVLAEELRRQLSAPHP